MVEDLTMEEKLLNPYYQIMELKGEKLQHELESWTREELIEWLCWNDRNGIYRDKEIKQEDENGRLLDKKIAIEIIIRQITE